VASAAVYCGYGSTPYIGTNKKFSSKKIFDIGIGPNLIMNIIKAKEQDHIYREFLNECRDTASCVTS
jgi:hypothetical protein